MNGTVKKRGMIALLLLDYVRWLFDERHREHPLIRLLQHLVFPTHDASRFHQTNIYM